MAEAMAEARRILAATEAGVWTYNGPWRGLVFGAGGALVSRHIARDAMVDALAAFVGADDPGAYLAAVAR